MSDKNILGPAILLFVSSVFCSSEARSVTGNEVEEYSGELSPEAAQYSEEHPDHWRHIAQTQLKAVLMKQQNTNKAQNVILFLGDGMSIPTLAAARAYIGQQAGRKGEDDFLSFEKFPYTGLSKTYCVDMQVADSACSATAYLSGVKANYGTIGVPATVKRKDCYQPSEYNNEVTNLMEWAQAAGKSTGLVTTTRVTHASPAGTYAHVGERNWEADVNVLTDGQDPSKCLDIATQLISSRTGIGHKVVFGGGRRNFLPNTTIDEDGSTGVRLDGVNLIKKWLSTKKMNKETATYIYDRPGLMSLDPNIDSVMGLFSDDHMPYHLDAIPDMKPTLEEMTRKAIQVLEKSQDGFVLFVEGGRIDQGHHEARPRKALDETVEFSKAVAAAVDLTDDKDTLIVVTSDHSHVMTYSGYSPRGNDILGLNGENGTDNLPYTTIGYANGPGNSMDTDGRRKNLSLADLSDINYRYPSLVPKVMEAHGGDDVAVFALGPWSHLFSGVYEQNVIPHSIAFASCIGNGLVSCAK